MFPNYPNQYQGNSTLYFPASSSFPCSLATPQSHTQNSPSLLNPDFYNSRNNTTLYFPTSTSSTSSLLQSQASQQPNPTGISCEDQSTPESGNDDRKKMWQKDEVLCLLDAYNEKRGDFKDPKKTK